jgi:hypothetical protein
MGPVEHSRDDVRLADEATCLCCGYNIGYITKQDIERWADEQIAAFDCPDVALLDLSMIRDTHPIDVTKLLETLGKPVSPARSVSIQIGFIGLCYLENKASLLSAIRGLYALVDANGISDQQRGKIYWLDDAYDLAVTGYHASIAEVDADVREFIAPYVADLQKSHARLLNLRQV